jgi:hypothetical protein
MIHVGDHQSGLCPGGTVVENIIESLYIEGLNYTSHQEIENGKMHPWASQNDKCDCLTL